MYQARSSPRAWCAAVRPSSFVPPAGARVAGIVWRTIDLHFDEVIVVVRVPARHVKTIQALRRDALEGLFGARPARLDRKSISQQLAHTGRTLLVELTVAGAAGLVA